jgi:hypothetical protein
MCVKCKIATTIIVVAIINLGGKPVLVWSGDEAQSAVWPANANSTASQPPVNRLDRCLKPSPAFPPAALLFVWWPPAFSSPFCFTNFLWFTTPLSACLQRPTRPGRRPLPFVSYRPSTNKPFDARKQPSLLFCPPLSLAGAGLASAPFCTRKAVKMKSLQNALLFFFAAFAAAATIALAAPIIPSDTLLPRHETRILPRQQAITQPVSFQTVTTTQTCVATASAAPPVVPC